MLHKYWLGEEYLVDIMSVYKTITTIEVILIVNGILLNNF